jgi:hypothetical protein
LLAVTQDDGTIDTAPASDGPKNANVDGRPAVVTVEASLGEVMVSPDPLARAKLFAWRGRWLAVISLGVAGVVGGSFRHQLQWGDVPTWIMAATTLLALLAAAFAGLVAYDLLKVENARDIKASADRMQAAADRRQAAEDRSSAEIERIRAQREAAAERAAQREDAHRAQASRVTAWFAHFHSGTSELLSPTRSIAPATWGGAVRNASDLPIFDVRIFYFRVNDSRDGSPWTAVHVYASIDIIRVIPPEQTRTEELPQRVRGQYEDCNDQVYVVGVEFTDADGNRWYRNERAALEPR